jgi:hypothetical protein
LLGQHLRSKPVVRERELKLRGRALPLYLGRWKPIRPGKWKAVVRLVRP